MASYARRFVAAGRAPRRRLLRHDAGAHAPDARRRARRRRPAAVPARPGRPCPPSAPPPDRAAGAAGREVAPGERARARPVRRSPSSSTPPRGYATQEFVEQARQLRIRGVDALLVTDRPASRARMSAARGRAARRAAGRHRDRAAVPLPRSPPRRRCRPSCSARTRSGCATCCSSPASRLRRGDYPDATRVSRWTRSASTNAVSAAQSRHRHRRSADRRADRVPHRRARQPLVARPRRGGAALSLQGRGRRRVRDDRAGVRRRGRGAFPGPGARGRRCRSSSPSARSSSLRRSRAAGQRSARPARPAGARRADAPGGHRGTEAAEGVAIAQELVEAVRPFAQGHRGAREPRPDLVFPVIARTLEHGAQIR